METKKEEVKSSRNYSLPKEFILEMIEKPKLNETFWNIAEQEPELKVGMLMALTRREFNQLKLNVK